MQQAIVKAEHFCVGVTHIPVGNEVTLPEPIVDKLVEEGKLEYKMDRTETPEPQGYNRRDMQAESNPVVASEPVKSKRKRRTKAEMEAARQAELPEGE